MRKIGIILLPLFILVVTPFIDKSYRNQMWCIWKEIKKEMK